MESIENLFDLIENLSNCSRFMSLSLNNNDLLKFKTLLFAWKTNLFNYTIKLDKCVQGTVYLIIYKRIVDFYKIYNSIFNQ